MFVLFCHLLVFFSRFKSVSGVATYTQKCILSTHLDKNMGRFCHYSDGLLMCVQNVCLEPILISLNQILTEFVMMLVSPFDDLSPIDIIIIYHHQDCVYLDKQCIP